MGEDYDGVNHPVSNATIWQTRGNFGSAVYDEYRGWKYIQIYICDACLIEQKDRVVEIIKETEVIYGYQPWRPVS